MSKVIGIDLGTTYSVVSYFNENKGTVEILPNKDGKETTPSVVGVNDKGEIVSGQVAKAQLVSDPDRTMAEIKRWMGEAQKAPDGTDVCDEEGNPVPYTVMFDGKLYTPEQISGYVLRYLKESAERALNEKVTAAVITVPAYFREPQRQATIEAGRLAGLEVKCLINEPTAAAIAYGVEKAHAEEEEEEEEGASKEVNRYLIYDLGGGTFDVSIVEVVGHDIEVKATHGDHMLGGVDFDEAITKWVAGKIKEDYGYDLERDAEARGRVRFAAEETKITLSSAESAPINLPFLFQNPKDNKAVNFKSELTRAEFEALIMKKIRGTLKSVDTALEDASLKKEDITDVLLVGGSTRIPLVRRTLKKAFGRDPRTDIHPDLCVSVGASMVGLKYFDVDEVKDEEAKTRIQEALDEQGMVVDVTGHTLGVKEGAFNMSPIIRRNTPIPAMGERMYQTSSDFQTVVSICVYQGEDPNVNNNSLIRAFDLTGIPPMPAGQATISISFKLDINGALEVHARNVQSGKEASIETSYKGISKTSRAGLDLPSAGAAKPVDTGPPIPADYKGHWKMASQLLPTLSGPPRASLQAAMNKLEEAVASKNEVVIEAAGDAFIDILFDVMPE